MSHRYDKSGKRRRKLWRVAPRKRWPYGWCLRCGLPFWPNALSRLMWDEASGDVHVIVQGKRRPPFILGPFPSELDTGQAPYRVWRRLRNIDAHYLGCYRGRRLDTGRGRKPSVPSADDATD